jgi:hypothetical protein
MPKALLSQVLLIAGFLAGGSATIRAADIQLSDSKQCAFKLSGNITSGDNDHLASLIVLRPPDVLDERTETLCLNSPGGLLAEGLKIAETIYTKGMSTLVAEGSECFSACAIIFMAGVVPPHAGPYRKLSARGLLGFHAPYLIPNARKYSKEEIEAAADGMRMAILGLLRLSTKSTDLSGNNFIKKSLVVELLDKGPEDLFLVKTISEAARWNIEIYDYKTNFPPPSNIDAIKNLCYNFHYSNIDEPIPRNPPELSLKVDKYQSKWDKNGARVLVLNSKTRDTVCEIYPFTAPSDPNNVQFRACSYDYWSDRNFGDCREYKTAPLYRIGSYVPSFFTLAPGTLLKPFQDGLGGLPLNQAPSAR